MIKEVRDFYGIPQDLFAGYLGVSRSQLSMAESGRRELPSLSYQKVVELFNAQSNSESVTDEKLRSSLKEQASERRKLIEQQLSESQFLLAVAKRYLTKTQAIQAKALKAIGSLRKLRKGGKFHDESFLGILENSARKLQRSAGIDKLLQTELKIIKLEAEIKYLKSL